jgi:hypothetical protein
MRATFTIRIGVPTLPRAYSSNGRFPHAAWRHPLRARSRRGGRRKLDRDFRGRSAAGPGDGEPIAQVARDSGRTRARWGNWVNAGRRLRGGRDRQLTEDERAELPEGWGNGGSHIAAGIMLGGVVGLGYWWD